MATVSLGGDKVTPDLVFRRESVHVACVVSHKVLLALATSHVHSDDGLGPRYGVAKLALAD